MIAHRILVIFFLKQKKETFIFSPVFFFFFFSCLVFNVYIKDSLVHTFLGGNVTLKYFGCHCEVLQIGC